MSNAGSSGPRDKRIQESWEESKRVAKDRERLLAVRNALRLRQAPGVVLHPRDYIKLLELVLSEIEKAVQE